MMTVILTIFGINPLALVFSLHSFLYRQLLVGKIQTYGAENAITPQSVSYSCWILYICIHIFEPCEVNIQSIVSLIVCCCSLAWIHWHNFTVITQCLALYGGTLSVGQKRWFGQPAPQTHPHILQEGYVTPGITVDEYRRRRFRLMELIGRKYRGEPSGKIVVVIPSAAKSYMSADIPYPFRQNTDFFYLCGFLEPDSILVLEADCASNLPEHRSTLYVPRRDKLRELWDGPRSGTEGAALLTGVDSAQNNDTFGEFLETCIDRQFLSLWYDTMKPASVSFHARFSDRMLLHRQRTAIESPRPLVQSLRLIKSPAEIELMKQTCRIASQSFKEVMKFSVEGVRTMKYLSWVGFVSSAESCYGIAVFVVAISLHLYCWLWYQKGHLYAD